MEYKIAFRNCTDELGQTRIFHYFLTVDLESSPGFCLENYGVRIIEEGGDACALPALTTSPSRIDELMTTLVDNRVGPAGLSDVVRDWMLLTSSCPCCGPASAAAVPAVQ